MNRNRGRFHFMFVSSASEHDVRTFCCFVPVYGMFFALSKFLSALAWTNNYENYSFLLDHMSVISGFLSNIALFLGIFAALRLALDFAYRKISAMNAVCATDAEHDGAKDDLLRRRAGGLAGFCAFSIHTLNLACTIVISFRLFLFARMSWAHY